MIANLSDIIKIPVSILAGALLTFIVMAFYYEGLSLPIVGQVINGRVANAAAEARLGYVQLAEKTAADAKAAELQRQLTAANQRIADYEKQRLADELISQAQDAQAATEVADYEKKLAAANRQCNLGGDDVEFLLAH